MSYPKEPRASGWPPMSPLCEHAPRGAYKYCTPGSIWLWHKTPEPESSKIGGHLNIEAGRRRANVPAPGTDEV